MQLLSKFDYLSKNRLFLSGNIVTDAIFVGMGILAYNELKDRAGMLLCTAGSREVLINGILYHIKKGVLCFLSPIISIYEMSRSDDYEEVSIHDNGEVFYQAIKLMYDMILSFRLRSNPCLMLDDAYIRFFLERKYAIDDKKAALQGL